MRKGDKCSKCKTRMIQDWDRQVCPICGTSHWFFNMRKGVAK